MKARELFELLTNLNDEQLDYDIIVHDTECRYDGESVTASVAKTDLVAEEGNMLNAEWFELYTPDEFAKDYLGEPFDIYAREGQITITISV